MSESISAQEDLMERQLQESLDFNHPQPGCYCEGALFLWMIANEKSLIIWISGEKASTDGIMGEKNLSLVGHRVGSGNALNISCGEARDFYRIPQEGIDIFCEQSPAFAEKLRSMQAEHPSEGIKA